MILCMYSCDDDEPHDTIPLEHHSLYTDPQTYDSEESETFAVFISSVIDKLNSIVHNTLTLIEHGKLWSFSLKHKTQTPICFSRLNNYNLTQD